MWRGGCCVDGGGRGYGANLQCSCRGGVSPPAMVRWVSAGEGKPRPYSHSGGCDVGPGVPDGPWRAPAGASPRPTRWVLMRADVESAPTRCVPNFGVIARRRGIAAPTWQSVPPSPTGDLRSCCRGEHRSPLRCVNVPGGTGSPSPTPLTAAPRPIRAADRTPALSPWPICRPGH